jgi:hypothetical protein
MEDVGMRAGGASEWNTGSGGDSDLNSDEAGPVLGWKTAPRP